MKISEFRKLIREEVRKVVNEVDSAYDPTLNVLGLKGSPKDIKYSKLLDLIKTNKLAGMAKPGRPTQRWDNKKKDMVTITPIDVNFRLYDYEAQKPLSYMFKQIQQDLFALGYKWQDGDTNTIKPNRARGGDLSIGIDPVRKTIDTFRD